MLRYYRSADATITTGDASVGTAAVAGLAAFGSRSASLQLTAPATAGTYYYGACVDAVTNESDTRNNCSASVEIRVQEAPSQGGGGGGGGGGTVPESSPDLVAGSVSVSDAEPSGGGTLTLTAAVRNDGAGAAAATTVRFYQSADETIASSDTEVGDGAVVALPLGSGVFAEATGLSGGTTHWGLRLTVRRQHHEHCQRGRGGKGQLGSRMGRARPPRPNSDYQ